MAALAQPEKSNIVQNAGLLSNYVKHQDYSGSKSYFLSPIPPIYANEEAAGLKSQHTHTVPLSLSPSLSALATIPHADVCVCLIDSSHLTSAMSEQRSIRHISARKAIRRGGCACVFVCVLG